MRETLTKGDRKWPQWLSSLCGAGMAVASILTIDHYYAAKEFYNLEVVVWPSLISPFWTAKATEDFEEAPIRIVEYADLLCSDCLYLHEQLKRLKTDFAGQMNIAFQFFPLEAKEQARVHLLY